MKTTRVLVAWLLVAAAVLPSARAEVADVPYGVADSRWEETLGNHRARVQVCQKADAVRVHLPWRRRDRQPHKKNIIVVDAATGQRVLNVARVNVHCEFADVVFQPATVPGEYFVYYMPFEHSGRGGNYRAAYVPPEATAEAPWLERHGLYPDSLGKGRWKGLPEGKVVEFQARTEFDRFDPMEVVATAEEVKGLLVSHPDRPYLLFPEDRQHAVRMTEDLPLCWIRRGPSARFQGEARPGEFYVFQIGVYSARQAIEDIAVEFSPLRTEAGAVIPAGAFRCFNLGGTDWLGRPFRKTLTVEKGTVQALWCGVQVPQDAAKGTYQAALKLRARNAPESTVELQLSVAGEVLKDCGDDDLWRLARLRWLDSTIGLDDEVTAPFTPVEAAGRIVKILGRQLRYSAAGLPESIQAWGRETLAAPIKMIAQTATGEVAWVGGEPKIVGAAPGKVVWESSSTGGRLGMTCRAEMEFDGHLDFRVKIKAADAIDLEDIRLEVPMRREVATYMMGLTRKGGYRPKQWKWQWEDRGANQVWIGEVDAGLCCHFKTPDDRWSYFSGLPEAWANGGKGAVEVVEEGNDRVVVRAHSGARRLQPGQEHEFRFALMITPFKPLDPAHWSERYCDGWPIAFPLDRAKELGVTVSNLHQSTPPNPYINYPFLALDTLSPHVEDAHGKGIKVKLYYTVRLLSNHAVELWPLRSLGEVFSDGSGGQDQFATHPWLQEHLVDRYSCGWPEPLKKLDEPGEFDSGLNQVGLSRWHNHYLEGLRWLIENVGVDGIYLDGIGYDRQIMKRVRKVMDRAKPGCLIDFHSGNGYSYADRKVSPACRYMEHFPFVNSLWFGEMYDYDETPDYWLVEISGIPFGLFGEMLGPGSNPWRGMIYGMTGRYYQANRGEPRHIWRLWDEFGIQDAKMIGYWDPACPIRTDHKDVLATAYCKKGKVLVALASWGEDPGECRLKIDWDALGLDPRRAHLFAPAIPGFQAEALFGPSDAIPVGGGWLFILDEQARKGPATAANAYKNRELILDDRFDRERLGDPWRVVLSSRPDTTLKLHSRAIAIEAAANTCAFAQRPLPPETAIVECRVSSGSDRGASWGPGLALVWPDKLLQFQLRSDGGMGISDGAKETVVRPATPRRGTWNHLRIRLEAEQVVIECSADGLLVWEKVHALSRSEYPDAPKAVRLGKMNPRGTSDDYPTPGPGGACAITTLRVFVDPQ